MTEIVNPREIVEQLADWWSDGGDVETGPARSAMYDNESTWGKVVRQCIDSEDAHDRLIASAPALLAACKADKINSQDYAQIDDIEIMRERLRLIWERTCAAVALAEGR